MEERLIKIFTDNSNDANNGQMSVITEDSYFDVIEEIVKDFKSFTLWKDSPRCPYSNYYNGTEKGKDRVTYGRDGRNYTLDQLFNIWLKERKK